MKPYKYLPLGNSLSEFRVLIVHPAADSSCQLCISLLPCGVDEHPGYTAISYMWGASVPTHAVTIVSLNTGNDEADATDDGEIKITENLAQALQQHRHVSQTVYLWADQLCIDQQNIPERSSQVRIMSIIFKNADRVHCWLGLDPFGLPDGVATWKKLECIMQYCGSFSKKTFRQTCESIDLYDAAILGPQGDIIDMPLWEAIVGFLQNPFWQRAWIMPEVTGQKVYIMFQNAVIRWQPMILSLLSIWWRLWHKAHIQHLHFSDRDLSFINNYAASTSKHKELQHVILIRYKMHRDPTGLFKILEKARYSVATDPRDKIYAAVACMNVVEDNSLLAPDYSSPVQVVYGRVVEYMTRTLKNLRILAAAAVSFRDEAATDLPSWMPDWRVPASCSPDGTSGIVDSLYNAYCSTQAPVQFDTNYMELRLVGFSVNTIGAVSIYINNNIGYLRMTPSQYKSILECLREWYALVFQLLGEVYRTGIPTLDAFCTTLMMDILTYPRRRGNKFPTSFIEERLGDLDKFIGFFNDIPRGGFILWVMYHHKLFISQDGYIGLCCTDVQPGDEIVILLGGHRPAVLRPVEGGYKFMGFAYVHGLMDGEAMAGLATGQYQMQEITLI